MNNDVRPVKSVEIVSIGLLIEAGDTVEKSYVLAQFDCSPLSCTREYMRGKVVGQGNGCAVEMLLLEGR